MTNDGKRSCTPDRRMPRAAPALLLALLVLAVPVFETEAIELSRRPSELEPARNLRIQEGKLLLRLEDAIALALERNLSLVVERYRQSESLLGLKSTFGMYDLTATSDVSTSREVSPTASNLGGADVLESRSTSWNLGLSRLLPSGGSASADWRNTRSETNSFFATLNPSYRVDLDLSFTQPLLRDYGREVTERSIRIARTGLDISRETFELQVIGVLQEVEQAYWDLVEAQEQYVVAEESLKLAEELHEQNRVRVEVGTLAPLELVQSEAGIATRKEEIIRARAAIGDAEDRVRQLLNLESGELWNTPIVPETDPEMLPVEIDLDQALEIALERRPDLRIKRHSQRDLEADIGFYSNQKLPRLDLAVTYGLNGLGGDVTERDFFTREILREAPGDYGDAIDQIGDADFEGWRVALNVLVPVQNRTGKNQAALARVASDRGRTELRDLELGAITAVRRLARLVETAAEARESARVSRRLAEKNLDAEQKRYENGMSTSFQVLQIQEDLTEARSREVNAITGYRKALVLFYQATGELIDRSGIEIADDVSI